MAKPLRALIVEDVDRDALLVVRTLRRGGFDVTFERVDTPEAMAAALTRKVWDIVISDYSMPLFSAPMALGCVKERNLDLPFIIVSGTVGEDVAVEAMRAGAHDFMAKGNLARLLPAVERELREAATRRERRQAQRDLRASEGRFQSSERRFNDLFEFAPDAIVITSRQGIIMLVNGQAERMFGWPRAELVGQAVEVLVPPQDREGHVTSREGYLHAAVPRAMGGGRSSLRGLRKDGSVFPVEISLSPMESDGELLVAAAARDITERSQLEARLLQVQRLESVGQLAAGIAHDFNNLLTVINSTAELAASSLPESDPMREEFAAIRGAGASAAALTAQLLAFSRKQILQPAVVNLNTTVANVQGMLRRIIREDIDLRVLPGEGLANVRVDAGQMEQVILNLAINSRDAMPEGGSLMIETANVVLDETYTRTHPAVQPGPYVMLAISDTGIGMDEATREKIFQPFFTTKAQGRGSGLGLSTAYGIVKQSSGNIWVYSEVGQGTTIKIYLPTVDAAVHEGRPARAAGASRGTETILVVEDDERIGRVAKRILELAGYTVLMAARGGDALRLLENHHGPVHLMLTDVVMPGMSGGDLAVRLEVSHPLMKVLYTSGHTDNAIVHHGVLDEGLHFLAKPYSVADLTRKVREVLDP